MLYLILVVYLGLDMHMCLVCEAAPCAGMCGFQFRRETLDIMFIGFVSAEGGDHSSLTRR